MLIDTSALVSLFNQSDPKHPDVRDFINMLLLKKERLEVTDTVYEELLALLRKRVGKEVAVMAAIGLTKLPVIELVETTNEVLLSATEVFLKHTGKYSYVDCTLVIIAGERKKDKIISLDRDFLDFGLEIIP